MKLEQTQAVAATALPKDGAKYVERREGCDPSRSEHPDSADTARMIEVNRELKKLCKGTDKKLLQLKQKYAANPTVTARLAEFEPNIEPSRYPPAH